MARIRVSVHVCVYIMSFYYLIYYWCWIALFLPIHFTCCRYTWLCFCVCIVSGKYSCLFLSRSLICISLYLCIQALIRPSFLCSLPQCIHWLWVIQFSFKRCIPNSFIDSSLISHHFSVTAFISPISLPNICVQLQLIKLFHNNKCSFTG